MDDVMGKIGELLSDEESVKQLSELAQMIMGDSSSASSAQESPDNETESGLADSSPSESGFPDIGSLMKLTGLMSSMSQNDKNAELLLALKPHLKEEKQKKIDKAIKLLKVIAIWNMAKESGLLKELL
ncbi:MAG: hypothetical protein IJY19_04035 [Ruminococcus sp.]|nr:hypothetical protein [Ruminococcus sp.]